MDKRFQVFISSTYKDLIDERKEVMQALLELDCIPAGMELFPASDDTSWELIQRVIDQSDYYIVVVGNRYGSTTESGISFTEKEYDYAVSKNIPTLAFLHKNPEDLPNKHSEVNQPLREKLNEFRRKLESKQCKYWENAAELGAIVSRSMVAITKINPRIGWIRSDESDPELLKENSKLRKRIEELELEISSNSDKPPDGTSGLMQGEDVYVIKLSAEVNNMKMDLIIKLKWNSIFAVLAPFMIHEASNLSLEVNLKSHVFENLQVDLKTENNLVRGALIDKSSFVINRQSFLDIIVQLKALGYIQLSKKQHTQRDTATYWSLTPYGDTIMTRLRALKRPAN